MEKLDEKLTQAFIKAGISAGELVPRAEELRYRLRPLVEQAFIDAGYMPGQEWYDKFKQELSNQCPDDDQEGLCDWQIDEAAKKAAGIE